MFAFILPLALLIGGLEAKSLTSESRIIGGTSTSISAYPFMVSLRYGGQHFCGATIYNQRFILTAAHCVYALTTQEISNIRVHLGANTLRDAGSVYRVERIITHPNYNTRSVDNDIALIKLSTAITFGTNIRAATIGSVSDTATVTATALGWGLTSPNGRLSNNLLKVDVRTITNAECARTWRINNTQMCTRLAGKGVCSGDSGGPLIINGNQVGITSFGGGCASQYPEVFARVSAYNSWLSSNAR